MAEEQAAHHLLNVLEERELNIDLDKVLAAFEDEDNSRAAAEWVDQYLKEETLLTREEFELYQTLKKKGLLHQHDIENEPIRPFLDHEISSAIDALQSSTSAIEEQCKVLEAQKEALIKLKALDKPNLDVEHARNERRRREGQERVRLDGAVEDVSISINDQLADTQREVDAEKSTLKSYVADRLASDDQVLSRLPGIVSQILAEPEVNEDEESIEQWCKAIVSFRTAEIKARVDTVYLKSLSKSQSSNESEVELQERKAALQAELEDLHSEIASVAEMVVEHELRKPMMEMKERKERDIAQTRSAWLKYVLTTLDYMGKRLDTVTSHTSNTDQFQQALSQINQAASKRMADPHAETTTPSKRRTSAGPQSAFTPAFKLKPSKSLDLPPALQDALRHAGISFNQDSIESLRETLIKTQLERDRKLHDHYATASLGTQKKLAERLTKADTELRGIVDALFAYTPFQDVKLVSSQLEDRLKKMEKELDEKDHELLDAEANELSLSDPKVQAFIAKHGR